MSPVVSVEKEITLVESHVGRPGDPGPVTGPSSVLDNSVVVFDGITGDRLKQAAGAFAGAGIIWVQSQGPTNGADLELHNSLGTAKAYFSYSEITDAAQVRSQTDLHITAPNGNILLDTIPTSDPGAAGALWNDSGTLKISAG